jgi:hypothetical protein
LSKASAGARLAASANLTASAQVIGANLESVIMPRRLSGSAISVSFSTRGALMPAWMVQHVAAMAGVSSIDIDATSAIGARLATIHGSMSDPYVPVRTIWQPVDTLRSSRNRRLLETVMREQSAAPIRVVATISAGLSSRELARAVDSLQVLPEGATPTIGLSALCLKGGRPHLVQLSNVRRFAEEWNLGVAIDLCGRFDPTWEAEAAIARLGDRLSVLRVSAAAPSRSAVGRDRVACRALHAAMDRGLPLELAVASVRPVPFPVTPRAAAHGAQRSVEYVAERSAFHARALREGIDHFEGSPSSRGI